MFEIIFAVTLVVAYAALLMWLIVRSAEEYSLLNSWSFAALATLILGCSLVVYAEQQESEKGPCLRWETDMYWNAATKTMMPARVCVQRGEWVRP